MHRHSSFALALCAFLLVGLASAQDNTATPTPLPTINIIVATDTPGPTSTPRPTETISVPPSSTPTQTSTPRTFARGIEIFLEGQDIGALQAQLQQLNVSWVRMVINWRDVEMVKGTLNLTAFDEAIEALAANYSILLTLTGAPDWSRPSATPFVLGLPQYGPPDNLADFATFAGTIAARYRGQIAAYEIWQEPNLRRSWIASETSSRETARMASARYIDLLSGASAAIRAADPDALILSAGLAPTSLNDLRNSIDDEVFMEALFQQGLTTHVDVIAIQPDGFGNPPAVRCCTPSEGAPTHWESKKFYFLDIIDSYRAIATRANAAEVPMWITRLGWGSAEGNNIVSPNMVENPFFTYNSPAEQSAYVMEALSLAQGMEFIDAAFIFNLNGCPVGRAEACFYSLIDSNNQARPLFNALSE